VLDDGRLTDSKGRTVDFKNTVLIMTSNVGASHLATAWASNEDGFEESKGRVMDELRKQFRPEFLNRVDDIVIFHPLGEDQLTHIIDLRLKDLESLLADRKITLEITPEARHLIFATGYDRGLRCSPAQACYPAPCAGPVGYAYPRWRGAPRRSRRRGRQRRPPRISGRQSAECGLCITSALWWHEGE